MAFNEEVAEAVRKCLEKEFGGGFSFEEEEGVFDVDVELEGAVGRVKMLVRLLEEAFINYTVIASETDEAARPALAEYIARVNFGLPYGCFIMDYESGAIGYRSYVCCHDGVPGENAVRNAFVAPSAVINKYGKGLMDVLNGKLPGEAIEEAETETGGK